MPFDLTEAQERAKTQVAAGGRYISGPEKGELVQSGRGFNILSAVMRKSNFDKTDGQPQMEWVFELDFLDEAPEEDDNGEALYRRLTWTDTPYRRSLGQDIAAALVAGEEVGPFCLKRVKAGKASVYEFGVFRREAEGGRTNAAQRAAAMRPQ